MGKKKTKRAKHLNEGVQGVQKVQAKTDIRLAPDLGSYLGDLAHGISQYFESSTAERFVLLSCHARCNCRLKHELSFH